MYSARVLRRYISALKHVAAAPVKLFWFIAEADCGDNAPAKNRLHGNVLSIVWLHQIRTLKQLSCYGSCAIGVTAFMKKKKKPRDEGGGNGVRGNSNGVMWQRKYCENAKDTFWHFGHQSCRLRREISNETSWFSPIIMNLWYSETCGIRVLRIQFAGLNQIIVSV